VGKCRLHAIYSVHKIRKENLFGPKSKRKKLSSKRTFENSTGVLVKSYLIMNSHGYDRPLVYCIADKSLDDEAVGYDAIVELARSISPRKFEYLSYTLHR
jgi:hypothetical protein